jgi:argininosuccinate lyase
VETVRGSLQVLAPMIAGLRFDVRRLRQAAGEQYVTATDVADYLVGKGLPFRQAHEVVGQVVRYAIAQGKRLEELPLADLTRFSPLFDETVYGRITVEASLQARGLPGGTAPEAVRQALALARSLVEPGP